MCCKLLSNFSHHIFIFLFFFAFFYTFSTFISSLVFFCRVFIVSLTCKYIHASIFLSLSLSLCSFYSANSFEVFFVFALATTYLHSLSFLSSSWATRAKLFASSFVLFLIVFTVNHIKSYNLQWKLIGEYYNNRVNKSDRYRYWQLLSLPLHGFLFECHKYLCINLCSL